MTALALNRELQPEMQELLEKLADELSAAPDPMTLPPAEGRAQTEKNNRRWNVNLPRMHDMRSIRVAADSSVGSNETPLLILEPETRRPGTILFIHGGGFAFCSPSTHERFARVLAEKTRMTVALPDYRLAPENPFPAGLHDVIGTLRALLDGEIDGLGGPVYIAGDSAGANLSLAAMLNEVECDRPLPQGALLFYGNYAMNFETPSYRVFRNGPGLTTDKMKRYWGWYAASNDIASNPLACPLQADDTVLGRLPPLYLTAAGIDPLYSDTVSLHERLLKIGRKDEFAINEGVVHGFLQYTNELTAAEAALEDAAQALSRMA
ncbi:alpha/beta hydrolase [Brucellaceae bacterium VT-16-1752]|uniref:Alpha/beta hydrolase n=1 Tax=Ochrobactrum soli TaxID=2448455 RepID=A0A849KU06_9HYPH|nr:MULTISPECIES: alpha/beta hydrolase [Brucella]NNU63580.1 alpha/beta hydrolase [[Ochrobactrum] soli]RRD25303.1 alpha/beta hydrolase [Brucellaceae bacterium VT-16-1752]WHS29983.1 alpha/beta hydrolase [Brucella sp. NM4]WHT44529.1 alpha/beta hydrolase [Ochrobactrum sp. SSR]